MDTRVKRWFFAALLVMSVSLGVAQYKSDSTYFGRDEQALLKLEGEWAKAMEGEDVAALEKILPDDYTMVDSAGVTVGRAEVLNQFRSGALKLDSFSTAEIKARVFQGGGVLTGLLSTKGKYKETDISGAYRFVDVFEFRKGGWKPVYTQLSKIQPPK